MATKKKGPTLRTNRAKLLRALPHALWKAGETYKGITTKQPRSQCLHCKNDAFCLLHHVYWPIREDEQGHYLSIAINDADKVSYASKEADRNDEERRVKLTFARYVRRNLGIGAEQISDNDLAAMQARLIASTKTEFGDQMKILRGEEVRAAYLHALGHTSCMTGKDRQSLLDMYVLNPDQIGLLVFEPKPGTKYRALIWELDDGSRFMDRIYPSDGVGSQQLLRWAKAEGIHVSEYMVGKQPHVAICTVPNGVVTKYPYMDSFRHGRWADAAEKGITWRTSGGISDTIIRKEWPLYIDGNTLRDVNDRPIPCAKCRKNFSKKQLTEERDGNLYCADCLVLCNAACTLCNVKHWYADMVEVINMDGRKRICKTCAGDGIKPCAHCLEPWEARLIVEDSKMCPHCDSYCKQQAGK